jgi:predicted ATPase
MDISDKSIQYGILAMTSFLAANKIYDLITNKKKEKALREAVEKSKTKEHKVYKFVITGGPCSGKTSSLTLISDRLRERGFRVYCSPECATIVFGGGVTIDTSKITWEENIKLHASLITLIMNQEDRYIEFSGLEDRPTVILFDRGALDVRAYMSKEGWQALLDENGWNQVELRDKRYDAVFHLVTAANGAEEYYNLNNGARYENAEEARATDKRLIEAWYGHPNYFVIDNKVKSFEEKLEALYSSLLGFIGLKNPPRYFNKYLLKEIKYNNDGTFPFPKEMDCEVLTLEDTFIERKANQYTTRLRKRGQKGSFFYQQYMINATKEGKIFSTKEIKKLINSREYLALYDLRDKNRAPIKRVRQTFVLDGNFCFMDNYISVEKTFSVLSLNRDADAKKIKLPKGLVIDEDVTTVNEFEIIEIVAEKKK